MIYLDVTSSCKSPMNTGVQRVVREIYRSLAVRTLVTPVLWDPGLASYCTLSRREQAFLVAPFGKNGGASGPGEAEPGRRANRIPLWSKAVRRLTHRRRRLRLAAELTAADTLFVPEIFQDNRLDWLAELAGMPGVRVAGVCHDAIAWRRPEITPPARQAGFARYLDVLRGFRQVICVSHEVRADLQTYWEGRGGQRADLSVAGWPVNHAGAVRPAIAPPRGETPSILCVATFEPRKNHLVLLAAADLLWARGRRFELVLVGRTTAHWGARVVEKIARLQSAGRPVRWLRHVNDRTLNNAYAACALTVFPSLIEGFGLPVLESLWHARPCVCGGNGALGEIAAGGGCLVVDQREPAALALGIERMLCNPELYESLLGQAARRPFDDWEQYAEMLVTLFNPSLPRPILLGRTQE